MSETQHAAIAEQAYFLWLKDGQAHGRAAAHWAAAEAMLAGRKAVAAATRKRKPAAKAAIRPVAAKKPAIVLHA